MQKRRYVLATERNGVFAYILMKGGVTKKQPTVSLSEHIYSVADIFLKVDIFI